MLRELGRCVRRRRGDDRGRLARATSAAKLGPESATTVASGSSCVGDVGHERERLALDPLAAPRRSAPLRRQRTPRRPHDRCAARATASRASRAPRRRPRVAMSFVARQRGGELLAGEEPGVLVRRVDRLRRRPARAPRAGRRARCARAGRRARFPTRPLRRPRSASGRRFPFFPKRCSSPRRSRPMLARCVQKTKTRDRRQLTMNTGECGSRHQREDRDGQDRGADQRRRGST